MGLLWADSLVLDYGEKDIYMTNLASESYDNLVYPSKPFPYTSINMLAAQARIWGLEPVPIRGAKVLELGSSFGGNIISQALYFPESQFVGIDLSETQIKEGQKIIATMGLTNIRLEEANIMDIDKSFGSFDYIIVHGIWSWVPDVVKEKILTICSQNLTEQGIAYVSYNTYPGWKRLDQIRDMMLFASEGQENLLKATQEGKAFIKGVAEAIQVDKDASHKRSSLLQDIDIILQKSDYYVAHEHLATFNDPVYVSDFISRAEAAGCAYIGDSNFQLSFTSWLDQEIKNLIESWDDQDQARREQIIDYMKNTQFRRALLTSQANGKHAEKGLDNGNNTITNVAPGVNGTDGVNVNQLTRAIGNVDNKIADVGAASAAMAGLKPLQYDPLEPTQILAAVGNYKGSTAAAIGLAHYTNESTMLHMGLSLGGHDNMVNAGISYKFGSSDAKKAIPDRYKAGPISSAYVLQDEVTALKAENQRMKERDVELSAKYDQVQKDNEEMKAQIALLMKQVGLVK